MNFPTNRYGKKGSHGHKGPKRRPSAVSGYDLSSLPNSPLLGGTFDIPDSGGSSSSTNDSCEEVMKLLISRGAAVNAKDKYRLSALHHAAIRGNESAIKALLSERNIDKEVLQYYK